MAGFGILLRVFETWLTARLLSSPTFHRAVHRLHGRIQRIKSGKDPTETGGTHVERPESSSDVKKLFEYFKEELQDQIRGGKR
jgi:hypothetical protein